MTASLEEYRFFFAKYKQKSETRHWLGRGIYQNLVVIPEPGSDLVMNPGGNLELQLYKLCRGPFKYYVIKEVGWWVKNMMM